MWVKICATTNVEDALTAVEAGADAVGFVFAESSRQVTVEQVAAITPRLPGTIEKIGVFTTTDLDALLDASREAGLTGIQLHCEFDPAIPRELKARSGGALRLVQVIDFDVSGGIEGERLFEETLRRVLDEPAIDAVLLDTAVRGNSGGTGVAFDWKRAAEILARVWPVEERGRLIVAGGLRPENVAEAIAQLQPGGVDVASGVEAIKGKKEAERVRAFVKNARSGR